MEHGDVEPEAGPEVGISTLIADAEILEDPATRRVWVEFSFAPKIKKKLLDPVQYARLSLQFQSQLRSSAGLALYEICVRYLTNPSHLTMREPWEWWRPILSGTPDTEAGDEAKREYKYFKRDYLRPAIAEVNAVTNIFVELIEHREGRRVAEIQFRVTERKQPMLALDEHPNVFDSTLVDRMVKLGIPLKEAQTLYADSEENRIRAALQMTEQRMRSTTLPPVRSAPALFKDALKKGYAPPVESVDALPAGTPSPKVAAAQPDDLKARLLSEFAAFRRKEAKVLYEEQGDAEREVARESFESEALPTMGTHLRDDWRKRGLDSKLAETAFSTGWPRGPGAAHGRRPAVVHAESVAGRLRPADGPPPAPPSIGGPASSPGPAGRFHHSDNSIRSSCSRIASRLSFGRPRRRNSMRSSPYDFRSPTDLPPSLISRRCA